MAKQNRKVKLHSQSRRSQQSCTGLKQVPWLNVSGVWLEQVGFNIVTQLEITVKENELIIKTAKHGNSRYKIPSLYW